MKGISRLRVAQEDRLHQLDPPGRPIGLERGGTSAASWASSPASRTHCRSAPGTRRRPRNGCPRTPAPAARRSAGRCRFGGAPPWVPAPSYPRCCPVRRRARASRPRTCRTQSGSAAQSSGGGTTVCAGSTACALSRAATGSAAMAGAGKSQARRASSGPITHGWNLAVRFAAVGSARYHIETTVMCPFHKCLLIY